MNLNTKVQPKLKQKVSIGGVLFVWVLFTIAEVLHGTLRTIFVEPRLGAHHARQLSAIIGSIIILLIVRHQGWRVKARSGSQKLTVGFVWLIMMLTFEFSIGILVGLSWERILEDYDIRQGGLLAFGMLTLLLSPLAIEAKEKSN